MAPASPPPPLPGSLRPPRGEAARRRCCPCPARMLPSYRARGAAMAGFRPPPATATCALAGPSCRHLPPTCRGVGSGAAVPGPQNAACAVGAAGTTKGRVEGAVCAGKHQARLGVELARCLNCVASGPRFLPGPCTKRSAELEVGGGGGAVSGVTQACSCKHLLQAPWLPSEIFFLNLWLKRLSGQLSKSLPNLLV